MFKIQSLALSVVAALLLAACEQPNDSKRSEDKRDASDQSKGFTALLSPEITPDVNGGAYASSLRGEIWYVHGDKAARVKGLPMNLFPFEIVPSVDGGAYAVTFSEGIWYLRKDTASRVTESEEFEQSESVGRITNANLAYFALWQSEKATRRALQKEISSARE